MTHNRMDTIKMYIVAFISSTVSLSLYLLGSLLELTEGRCGMEAVWGANG
jgi:hypothetical protein